MYKVCAKYCGTTILLNDFNNREEAEKFMKYPYLLYAADEFEDGEEDEIIYPNEMYIDTSPEIDSQDNEIMILYEDDDDLPF